MISNNTPICSFIPFSELRSHFMATRRAFEQKKEEEMASEVDALLERLLTAAKRRTREEVLVALRMQFQQLQQLEERPLASMLTLTFIFTLMFSMLVPMSPLRRSRRRRRLPSSGASPPAASTVPTSRQPGFEFRQSENRILFLRWSF